MLKNHTKCGIFMPPVFDWWFLTNSKMEKYLKEKMIKTKTEKSGVHKKKLLSVIVPVYNDSLYLEKCLKAIFNSDYPCFEVIVVNDASTDNSLTIAKKFPCKIIDLKKNQGVANARNKGADSAQGEILVFFDSDIVIEKDTLSRFAEIYENPKIKICECQVYPKSLSKSFAADITAVLWNYFSFARTMDSTFIGTMAFSIDKKVFNEIGKFNTSFESAGGEEFEIGMAVRRHGYKIYIDNSFYIHHHFQEFWPRFKTLYRRSYVYGKIVLNRNFRLDNSYGTMTQGINSLLSILGVLLFIAIISTFIISIFIPVNTFYLSSIFLLAILFTVLFQVFLDYPQNTSIIRKKGFIFFLGAMPLNYLWYFSMGLGVTKAMFIHYSKKMTKLFRIFSFLFSKTPPYVIFFVTSRCNAKCKHCFNWRNNQKKSNDLSLEEIEKISLNFGKIKYMTYSGGEPSIRRDIVEVTQLFYKNNKLDTLNFITNGFSTGLLIGAIEKILRVCPNLKLIITFSIDGIGNQHDKIRNVPGGFSRLLKSIEEAKKLKKDYPNLDIGAVITYSRYNKDNIVDVVNYINQNLKIDINLNYVRGDTFDKRAKEVNLSEYLKASKVINRKFINNDASLILRAVHLFCLKIVARTINENKCIIPCVVGKKLIEIGDDGKIFPCEILNKDFGNIRDYNYDIKKVLSSKKAKDFFLFLKNNKCYCTWECAINNNLLYYPRYYPALFLEWARLYSNKWK